ncbi:MAG: hypothetical protein M1457_03060, partial [bacterium]|nr:hypothetical protein [bacterium]
MRRRVVLLVWLVLLTGGLPARAGLVNGDFAAGLDGWMALGAADTDGGSARLSDGAGGAGSLLFQIVPLAAGPCVFSFDYASGLSNQVPTGTFADSFFVSRYFVDDPP